MAFGKYEIQANAKMGMYYIALLAVIAYVVIAVMRTIGHFHHGAKQSKTYSDIHDMFQVWGNAGFYLAILLFFASAA